MAFEYKIYEARITYADPTDQVYKAFVSETGKIITCIPVGVRRMKHGSVIAADNYTIGDLVFVLQNSMQSNAAPGQLRGFILGIFPGDAKTLVDAELQGWAEGEATEFYHETRRIYNNPEIDTTYMDKHRGVVASGDFIASGTDTLLHITDRTITVGSTDATMKTNAIDGSMCLESIVYENKTPGVLESVRVINDTILKDTRVYGNLNAATQPKESFIEQTGDLPYGNVRTVQDATGSALSRVSQRNDGSIKLEAATGIKLEKTLNIPTYTDYYAQLINRDEDIASLEDSKPEPFSRVAESDNWVATSRGVDEGYVLPVQRPVPEEHKSVEVADVTQTHTKSTVPAKSVLDIRDDGSIIIRDAWGSEIRMINGDIQISAANKIVMIADTDQLNYCGGVHAVKAGAGFQVKTDFGHIDMASAKEVNILANDKINVVGDTDVSIAAVGDIVVAAGRDYLLSTVGAAILSVATDFFVESGTANIVSDYDCTLTTGTAMLRVSTGVVDIASAVTNIHSDVEISGEKYDAGTLPTGKLEPMTGSGALRVGNTFTVDSGIIANDYIMTKDSVYAGQVNALRVAEDTGVYKLKNIPKVNTKVSDHKSKSNYRKEPLNKAKEKLDAIQPTTLLEHAFEAKFSDPHKESDDIAIYLPGYAVGMDSRDSMPTGEHHVAATGNSVYIYPGKDFWQADNVYVPNEDDSIDSDSQRDSLAALTTIVKENTYYEQ